MAICVNTEKHRNIEEIRLFNLQITVLSRVAAAIASMDALQVIIVAVPIHCTLRKRHYIYVCMYEDTRSEEGTVHHRTAAGHDTMERRQARVVTLSTKFTQFFRFSRPQIAKFHDIFM